MAETLSIEIAGEDMELHAARAMYWQRRQTLFIADLHLGKTASFRSAAIPLPGGTTRDDLKRLSTLIMKTGAKKLVVLGDFFHHQSGRVAQLERLFMDWRENHGELEITVIRGNHDLHAGRPPAAWRIECCEEPLIQAPFSLQHHPEPAAGHYVLCGHLHPGVKLFGPARQRARVPCFFIGRNLAMLPAFGRFTGLAIIVPEPADRIYALAEDEIIAIPQ